MIVAMPQAALSSQEAPAAFPRASFEVVSFRDGAAEPAPLQVICEHELGIVLDGAPVATLLCSRAHLEDLVCGFLRSEGVISSLDDIAFLGFSEDAGRADVLLRNPRRFERKRVVTSGFGGAALIAPSAAPSSAAPSSAAALVASNAPASAPAPLCAAVSSATAEDVREAVTAMRVAATEYAATRGTHCSALFRAGEMVVAREDIGRHNTFDKVAGFCLRHGIDAGGTLLATTGRVSSEMVRKALALGAAGVASLSGPTDVAVREARASGMLLAGYVSSTSLTMYAG